MEMRREEVQRQSWDLPVLRGHGVGRGQPVKETKGEGGSQWGGGSQVVLSWKLREGLFLEGRSDQRGQRLLVCQVR